MIRVTCHYRGFLFGAHHSAWSPCVGSSFVTHAPPPRGGPHTSIVASGSLHSRARTRGSHSHARAVPRVTEADSPAPRPLAAHAARDRVTRTDRCSAGSSSSRWYGSWCTTSGAPLRRKWTAARLAGPSSTSCAGRASASSASSPLVRHARRARPPPCPLNDCHAGPRVRRTHSLARLGRPADHLGRARLGAVLVQDQLPQVPCRVIATPRAAFTSLSIAHPPPAQRAHWCARAGPDAAL
jgi:hypothetical protein